MKNVLESPKNILPFPPHVMREGVSLSHIPQKQTASDNETESVKGSLDRKADQASVYTFIPGKNPRLHLATLEELSPIFSSIPTNELLSVMEKVICDRDFHWSDELEKSHPTLFFEEQLAIEQIVTMLWQRSNTTFFEKFSIIEMLERTLRDASPGDWESEERGSDAALRFIPSAEKNFFLKSLAQSFLKEGLPNPPFEARKEMVRRNWEEGYGSRDGEAWIYVGHGYSSVPISARSVDDLPESDIYRLTNEWFVADSSWISDHQLQEWDIVDNLKDASLEKRVITDSQLQSLASIPRSENACYALGDQARDPFISLISSEFGSIYSHHDGSIEEVFSRETVHQKALPITIDNIDSLSRFLIELKQAAPSYVPELRQELKKVSRFFQTRPRGSLLLSRRPRFPWQGTLDGRGVFPAADGRSDALVG